MKLRLIPAFLALLVTLPHVAQAESLITEYYSLLGPADAYNSRGAALNDFCAIAQQDSANWHKFGKREEFDAADPFFTTPARRALFTGRCQYDASYYANPGARIRNGTRHFYVHVRVFGNGDQVTRILISEGAG